MVAVGKTDASATDSGTVSASVDGGIVGGHGPGVGSLAISARSNSSVDVQDYTANGGIGGFTANTATAQLMPTVNAFIGNGSQVSTSGGVDVASQSEGHANSQLVSVQLGVVTVGLAHAVATAAPGLSAYVGSQAGVQAGAGIGLHSTYNSQGQTDAHAIADAPSGSLVGVDGTTADATSSPSLNTYVAAGATLTAAGAIALDANSTQNANSHVFALSIGALTVGRQKANATDGGLTQAHFDGSALGASALNVHSGQSLDTDAEAEAPGVAVVSVSVPIADALNNASLSASVGGFVRISGSIDVAANITSNSQAHDYALSIGVVAVSVLTANAEDSPHASAGFTSGANVLTGGSIGVSATHNVLGGSGAERHGRCPRPQYRRRHVHRPQRHEQRHRGNIRLFGGERGFRKHDQLERDHDKRCERDRKGPFARRRGRRHLDTRLRRRRLGFVARRRRDYQWRRAFHHLPRAKRRGHLGRGVQGGLVAASFPTANSTASPSVTAAIGDNASVSLAGGISITATSDSDAEATASGVVIGVVGIGSMVSNATVAPMVNAHIGTGSSIHAGGGISIVSQHDANSGGVTPRGANASATASGGGIVSGEGATPTATSNANVNSYVGAGTTISAGGDINIDSYSSNAATANAKALSIGAVAVGESNASAKSGGPTYASMNGTVTSAPSLYVYARGNNAGTTSAEGTGGGLIGVTGANASDSVSGDVRATLGAGRAAPSPTTSVLPPRAITGPTRQSTGPRSDWSAWAPSRRRQTWAVPRSLRLAPRRTRTWATRSRSTPRRTTQGV